MPKTQYDNLDDAIATLIKRGELGPLATHLRGRAFLYSEISDNHLTPEQALNNCLGKDICVGVYSDGSYDEDTGGWSYWFRFHYFEYNAFTLEKFETQTSMDSTLVYLKEPLKKVDAKNKRDVEFLNTLGFKITYLGF